MDCLEYKLDLVKTSVNSFLFLDGCGPIVASGEVKLLNI